MKKTDIERIIKQGSIRQKIKLYMTDIALVNVDMNNLDFTITGGELDIKGTSLLTKRERDILWESIKEPQDVKYYNELRTWNASFLFFKEQFTKELMRLKAIYFFMGITAGETKERENSRDLVNELLDLYPDKTSRDKALKKAIEITKGDGGKEYQEKGHLKYLDIDRALYWEELKSPTLKAISTAKGCKESIEVFLKILSKDLPLQPYKEWVKKQEEDLKKIISNIYNITTALEDCPTDFPKVELYQDVIAEVTEEDIADFKSSRL